MIEIPKKYLWEYDDQGTLLFYFPGEEIITIRVSVLSFERKDGKPSHGVDIVIQDAISQNLDYEIIEEGTVLLETPQKYKKEGNTDLIMQFWYIGKNNSLIIFSSTTILKYQDNKQIAEMKNDLKQIFNSIS